MINRIKSVADSFLLQKASLNTSKRLNVGEYTGSFKSIDLSFLTDEQRKKIVSDANRIIKKEYQIYNYPTYAILNWEADPVSGEIIKNAPCTALIKTSALINKADVKNWWEQGHLNCVLTLAQGYFLTSEELYAQECLRIIKDFSEKNPLGKSVSWKCHMDSAIRLANIVEAAGLIKASEAFKASEPFIKKIVTEHIVYVSSDYENKGEYPNNHYLSDLAGVIFGCVYLIRNYNNNAISCIFEDALDRFESELSRQICKDGFDYEFSTFYHCFVTELVCEVLDVLRVNGFAVPDSIVTIAGRMKGVCRKLGAFTHPLPLIGDQDSSRLFLLTGYFDFDRCNFSSLERFCLDEEGADTKSAGIYILEKDKQKVFFKCGAVGTGGKGTHDHNDQLSICFFYNKEEIICDSGTYVYTLNTSERQSFRSTKAHSTVHINQTEQNDISSVFSVKSKSYGEITELSESSVTGRFLYSNSREHERIVQLSENSLVIKDKTENGVSRLVVPVNIKEIDVINSKEICFFTAKARVTVKCTENIMLTEAEISRLYGTKQNATYIDAEISGEAVFTVISEEK